MAWIASSQIARFSSKLTPNGSSSVMLALSPVPNSTRPFDDQVERGDALGAARRVRRRQLHDAVAQADVLGALAGRAEKHLGGRRVRVFLKEMVLDLPGIVVAEPVGQFDLVERVLIEPMLAARLPRARQLQLVKDAEFHSRSSCGRGRSCRCRGGLTIRGKDMPAH